MPSQQTAGTRSAPVLVSPVMVASVLAAAALTVTAPAAHPCRAPLPTAPHVEAPIVLWTSCGSFRLSPGGELARLPRHWLAKHGSGTGRRYGAHLEIRRTRPGRFLLLSQGRVVWRSANLYPRDGDGIAFGPHSFAFASYRHGIYLTDLQHAERLVLPGRALYPYSFTRSGELIVTGPHAITLLSPAGTVLRNLRYRSRNGYGFDEQSDSFYYLTPAGRLAVLHGAHTLRRRSLAQIDGILTVARPNLLVFSGAHSITATTRTGAVIANAHWTNRRLSSDAGVSVAPTDERSRSASATPVPAPTRATPPSTCSTPVPLGRSRSTGTDSDRAAAPLVRTSAGTAPIFCTARATAPPPSSTPGPGPSRT